MLVPTLVAILSPAFPAMAVCEAPIRWRIADVDPRFGLTQEEVEWRVRAAGMLWEEGRGQLLFMHDPEDGVAIRFVWDGRQEADAARQEARGRLAAEEARLREVRLALEQLQEQARNASEGYELRLSRYEEDLRRHNAEIADWNARGGAPDRERERLDREREALDQTRTALDAEAAALRELTAQVGAGTQGLNQGITALNRESEWFRTEYGAVDVSTGEYLEPSSRFGRRPAMRDREIRIYRFESDDHLTMALARELGRALGLPLSDGVDGVMGTGALPLPGPDGPALAAADRAHLVVTCPRL